MQHLQSGWRKIGSFDFRSLGELKYIVDNFAQ